MYLFYVPQERTYTEKEVTELALTVMNLGMDLRQNQLQGFRAKSGKEVLEEYLDNFFAGKRIKTEEK